MLTSELQPHALEGRGMEHLEKCGSNKTVHTVLLLSRQRRPIGHISYSCNLAGEVSIRDENLYHKAMRFHE